MKTKPFLLTILTIAALAALAAGGYAGYRIGMDRGMAMASAASPDAEAPAMATGAMSVAQGEAATRRHIEAGLKAGDVDPATGQTILYYHDPMTPATRFDRPAKSPFMDMMLVPVYGGAAAADASTVAISPRVQQNLGVRTAPVTEGTLAPTVETFGSVGFNERDQVIVQARATGFVEKLHVRATLDRVQVGEPLADIYVPEWVAAQEEFLAVSKMQGENLAPLVDAARQRMRQAGMDEAMIEAVQRARRTQPRLTLAAPIGGLLTELLVREGMTVMAGATLFRINGLDTVWANAEVPETQALLLRPGAKAQASSAALPGRVFEGRLQALLPEVNPTTRTVKARLELVNRGGVLLPGMFVQMNIGQARSTKTLLVPTEAVLQTGQRTLVMLAEDDGRFRPIEVEIGIESGGRTQVLRGLAAGQRVVVSSQFLIDSEASLKGVEARSGGVRP